MKKMPKLLSAILFALAGPVANAYTVDTLLGSTTLQNSGIQTEINGLLAFTTLDPGQTLVADQVDVSLFDAKINGLGSWYIDIAPDTTGYFVLKFGSGRQDDWETHYYFENIAELTKLVWTNAQVDCASGWLYSGCSWSDAGNIGKLSHYTLFSTGPGNQIPEPATAALIGLGLLGIGALRRRKQS